MQFKDNQIEVLAKPELLAPAGNWDCLLAAVANGADAVYLGTREFNARVHARNFSLEELGEAVIHCHSHGVRIYLTMNTLVKNYEIRKFFDVLSDAYVLGIDGVIIQQVSFLQIIKDNYPGLMVFISTQAAVGNTGSASLLKTADRIILPREMPLEEVRKIVNSGMHVEVFVHGALCFSYSGLCLFSSFVSNRSGNRGSCAQLCRQKYNGTYPMSTRELCLVEKMPELLQAGITGFKIEGRMRSPVYVAVATRLYRKAIDSCLAGNFAVPQKEMAEIEVVFNREFTRGLIFHDRDLLATEKPMNRGALLGVVKDGQVVLQHAVAAGDGVGIWGENNVTGATIMEITANGNRVTSADTGDRVNLGLRAREGSRIYLTSSQKITVKPDFTVVRAPCVPQKSSRVNVALPEIVPGKPPPAALLVKAYSIQEAREAARAGAGIVFYDIFSADYPDIGAWQEEAILGAYLPRILNDAELLAAFNLLKRKNPGAILAGNAGFLPRRAEYDVPVYLDYTFNCFNDLDIAFYNRYSAVPILSPELSLGEMEKFRNRDAVIFCHGDIVLVNTLISIDDAKLTDDKGLVFPVRKEDSYWQVLNSRPFGMFNDVRKLHAAGFNQFFIDKQGKGAYYAGLYRNILKQEVLNRRMRKGYTAGHLYRPVE
jgi:collagenase-like PrtC family protease